jgi:hypothetical protein
MTRRTFAAALLVVLAVTAATSAASPAHPAKRHPLIRVHGTWTDPVGTCVSHVTSFDPATGTFTCTGTTVFTGTWVGSTTWTLTGRRDPSSRIVTGEIHEVFKGHTRGGRRGTLTFVEQLTEDATGKEDTRARIVRGSGGMAGSRGQVHFIGQSNPDNSGSGTYSGLWRLGK